MTPKDYEYLLVAADLAHVDKRWGFSIKMMKWRLFLEGHRFTTINCDGTFEVDVKKVDLNAFIEGESPKHREKVNFIRIGVLKASSHRKVEMQKDPHDGRMITTPPRLSGLCLQQSSFRRLIEPILWNYILEKDLNGEDDLSIDEDDSLQSVRKSPTSPPPLTAVSAAAITTVRASSLNDNDMSKLYPNLSHALGDDDG